MPAFRFVAIDVTGEVRRGVMEAADTAAVIAQLQEQGRLPVRAEPAAQSNRLRELLTTDIGGRRGLRQSEIADFTRELATMLAAGQDLERALRFVIEIAPNARVRAVLDRVREKVRGGRGLADALAAEPGSFAALHVGLVRAGEAGGALAEALSRLAGMLERERSLRATVQSALVYPALLLLAGIGSIGFLAGYVLPQFVPLFAQSGAQLPVATRWLMAFGGFLREAGPYLVLVGLALLLLAQRALTQPAVRQPVDRLVLRMPVTGPLLRESLAARFTRTLGTLLQNGVPLIAALAIVRDVLDNHAAMAAVTQASESAKGGAGLAGPLARAGVFPSRTIHLLRLGEETAQLAAVALRAADIHDERTRLAVQRLVALIVPAITILMGLAVAAIVGSVLMAMLSLNDLAA